MEMGDTIPHAEYSVSDICIEKCLSFVFLPRNNTDVGSVFLRHTWVSANTSLL